MRRLHKRELASPSVEMFFACACSSHCGCVCGTCICEGETSDSGTKANVKSNGVNNATSNAVMNIQHWG